MTRCKGLQAVKPMHVSRNVSSTILSLLLSLGTSGCEEVAVEVEVGEDEEREKRGDVGDREKGATATGDALTSH